MIEFVGEARTAPAHSRPLGLDNMVGLLWDYLGLGLKVTTL